MTAKRARAGAGTTAGQHTPGRSPSGRRATRSATGRGPVLLRAASQIAARDRWLIRMLHEHGVLTTPQILHLGFAPTPRSVQHRLAALHRLGILDRFQPQLTRGSAPLHHVLGPLGAQILAAELGVDVAALGWRRDRTQAIALRLSLAHDVATTDLMCELVTDPDLHIDTWWSAGRCRRAIGHHCRPDAYLALTTIPGAPHPDTLHPGAVHPGTVHCDAVPADADGSVWEMFVEYDTGTETGRVLAGKLHGYWKLAHATRTVVPVGIWIARPGREPTARRALAAAHRALPNPALVPVFTATPPPAPDEDQDPRRPAHGRASRGPDPIGPARRDGPDLAIGASRRVWLPLQHPAGQTPRRYRLAELAELAERRRGPTLAETTGPHRDDPRRAYTDLPDPRSGTAGPRGRVEIPPPSPYPPRPPARPGRSPAPTRTSRTGQGGQCGQVWS